MAFLLIYGWMVLVPLVGLIYFIWMTYYQARPLVEIAIGLFGCLCWGVAGGLSFYPFLITDSWQALAAAGIFNFAIIVGSLVGLSLNIFLAFAGVPVAVLAIFNVTILALVGVARRDALKESFQKSQEERYQKELEEYKRNLKNQFLEAVKSNDVETVNSLIQSRIDFLKATVNEPITLQRAVEHGHIEVIKALIQAGAKINPGLLWFAANESTARFLVEAGIDVNSNRGGSGSTALIWVSGTKRIDVVRLLIAAGADVNAQRDDGLSALMIAAMSGSDSITKRFVAPESNKEVRRSIATKGYADTVRTLIEAGADLHAKDKDGRTALMYASTGEVAKILIEAGADINAKDKKGETPLMSATRRFSTGAVKVLIEAGADVNAPNPNGETALKLAAKFGDTETINVLREAGATD